MVRLKPDRMRSKVAILYRLMVMNDSFDLISQPLRAASFPSRGSLYSEWASSYFYGQYTPPVCPWSRQPPLRVGQASIHKKPGRLVAARFF